MHNLGLEELGVKMTKRGAIDVDDFSRTSVSAALGCPVASPHACTLGRGQSRRSAPARLVLAPML